MGRHIEFKRWLINEEELPALVSSILDELKSKFGPNIEKETFKQLKMNEIEIQTDKNRHESIKTAITGLGFYKHFDDIQKQGFEALMNTLNLDRTSMDELASSLAELSKNRPAATQ